MVYALWTGDAVLQFISSDRPYGCLFLLLFLFVSHNIVEPELIIAHTCAHYAQPIPQLLFLQVFLGHVLQIASTELLMRDYFDLAVGFLADDDGLAEVARASVNLDAVV